MVMGAPGTSYWTGSVLVYNTTSNISAAYVDDDGAVLYGSYLGEFSNLFVLLEILVGKIICAAS